MAARQVPEPSRTIEKRYVQLESRPADPDGKAEAEAIEPAAERRAYPEEQTRLWKFIDGVFSQLRHDCPIFGILVIGETGTGKSTLINNLLGREVAVIGHTMESETQLVTAHELTVEGVPVVVYDTPGLDDTEGDDDEKNLDIMKKLLARKKIHLVIYCMKLTETRMRRGLIRTFKEYHKIGVPWEQTVVTITFADVIGDTTARFTQMQQHLKKILVEKVGVTSSVVDVLKICPTAKDPTAALPSGKQWYVPFWLDVVQVLVPAALVQFLHMHKDNIQIGEGTPVSRHPNPVNITLVGEDQKRFQREVDRLPELQATSVALPTGPAFPGPPQPTPVRDPVATTPLPMEGSGGIPPSQAATTFPVSELLTKHEPEFFSVVNARFSLRRLKRLGVITQDVMAHIDAAINEEDAQEILYEHLANHASVDTLMKYCEVIMAADGYPKMKSLGEEMMEELQPKELQPHPSNPTVLQLVDPTSGGGGGLSIENEDILSQKVSDHQEHLILFRLFVSRTAGKKGRAVLEGLGFRAHAIDACFSNHPLDEEGAVQEVLTKWSGGQSHKPPTWQVLLEAMEYARIDKEHVRGLRRRLGLQGI